MQTDAEIAGRLNASSGLILSDRKFAEQLQAQMEREATAKNSSTTPAMGPSYGRRATPTAQHSIPQSKSQLADERAFAQRLHEEE